MTSVSSKPTTDSGHARGVGLVLLSAIGFGLMAVFAKKAYGAGVSVTTLLALRFGLAAGAFWVIVALRSHPRDGHSAPGRPARRLIAGGLALGAFGYALEAAAFFGALSRMDASLTSLLLYIYPALVFAGAVAVGREHPDRARIAALAAASAGVALVLAGGASGTLDPVGVALAAFSAVSYAAYVLISDRIIGRVDPVRLGALVTTGAAAAFWSYCLLTGGPDLGFAAVGWAWIVALALVSTVGAISTFALGMRRIGPATASIVSSVEPVITVGLVMALFGERLAPVQLAGGVLVIGAVVALQLRGGGSTSVRGHVAPADLPAPAPARAAAQGAA